MAYRRVSSQTVLGGLIVLIGVLLLVETTDLADVSEAFRFVPSLFVLVGAYALVTSGFRNFVGPVIVIGVAGAWQLVELDVVTGDQVVQFWPLLVVLFGLSLVVGRMRSTATAVDDSYLDAFAVFGGTEKRSTSKTFVGAALTAVFGGSTIDLRDAKIAEKPARVSVTALFGGAEVVVPREWNVRLDVLPILGAATDERARFERDVAGDDAVDLVVEGFVAFGGVSVKD
jgi:hypothetical protein